MKKFVLLTAVLILCPWQALMALDKAAFEIQLRKNLNFTKRKAIAIGDPEPSPFAGLMMVPVKVDNRDLRVHVSEDGTQLYWGNVYDKSQYALFTSSDGQKFLMGTTYDLTKDPDAERIKKISLKTAKAKGSAKAPVTVVEYSDLQCPYCQKAHEFIKNDLYKTFKEKQVRVIFKHYPLSFHPWAEPAAIAAECAAEQNNFWPMEARFYEHGAEITKDNVNEKRLAFAGEIGLNKAKFEKCLNNPKILEKIKAERDEGESVGVSGTPAFVVNGRLIGGFSPDDVKAVIEEKLAESAK